MIDTVPFPEQTHAASGAGRERYARLDALLQQVIAQARALNIPISDRIQPHVRINRRATGRFGACFANKRDGTFLIEISDMLLSASDRSAARPWPMRSCTPAMAARTTKSAGTAMPR